MKKIFVISEYVNPNENTTGYYWHGIIVGLAARFDSIHLICPSRNIYRDVKNSGRINEAVLEMDNSIVYGDLKNVFIMPLKIKKIKQNSIISRVFRQINMTFSLLVILVRNIRRGDVVLCGTNPALLILTMPVVRICIAFKWIILIHDVFPENLIPAKILNQRNPIYFVLKKLFDLSYGAATLSISIGRDMQELVEKKVGVRSRVICIQNWVIPSQVYPISRGDSIIIQRLGWDKKIVFQFFGNMGRLQGIGNLLSAIELITHNDAAFLFVGDGAMASEVKNFIAARPNIAVAYLDAVALDDKNDVLSSCDVSLVTLEAGMLGLGVPSKSYFSLAADKPLIVVADSRSEVSLMVQEDDVGWCCEPGDPIKLASLIDQICLLNMSERHGRQRNIILRKYNDDISVKKIVDCVMSEYV